MHYLQLKSKISKILPKWLFDLLIKIWRNTFAKIINIKNNYKLKNFKNDFFKELSIEGVSFKLKIMHEGSHLSNQFYLYGIYEREIFKIMKNNLKNGDTFVDVGANLGMYTNFVPKVVGNAGKVIAFEPIKRIFNQNKESIEANNYKNVSLYNYALSDKEEKHIIYINNENVGGSSLYKQDGKYEEEIATIIGDEILLDEERVDFIKIDTEGFELHVLKGIEKSIKKFKPKIIIEFSPYLFSTETEGKEILDFLKTYYDNVYVIEENRYIDLKSDLEEYYSLEKLVQINLFYY